MIYMTYLDTLYPVLLNVPTTGDSSEYNTTAFKPVVQLVLRCVISIVSSFIPPGHCFVTIFHIQLAIQSVNVKRKHGRVVEGPIPIDNVNANPKAAEISTLLWSRIIFFTISQNLSV